MKVLIKSAWGSDESTKAAFAFLHANAFAAAGHEVQIFLLGEAVNLMRNETMKAVTPIGWPPLSQIMQETIGHKSRSTSEPRVHGPVRSVTLISMAKTLGS